MKAIVLAAAAVVLAACGTPQKQSFYTLVPEPLPAPASSATTTVFVGPVTIPEDVDRSAMVLRTGPNQVEIRDTDRWSEPLKSAIPRAISEHLMRELGTARVYASRAGAPQAADLRVAIEIRRFESSLDAGATIDALWTLTPAKGNPRSGRSVISESNATRDVAGIAAAHSRALARLARDLAGALRQ